MSRTSIDTKSVLDNIQAISEKFASERAIRQKATKLARQDFDILKETGYLLMAVPVELGGFWRSAAQSVGEICNCLRVLAHGDSSVALVSAMHPSVLASWLCTEIAPQPYMSVWKQQRTEIFEAVRGGLVGNYYI